MRMCEFETKIEIVGMLTDALIRYECDPEDGWPLIRAVEVGRTIPRLYDEMGKFLEQPREEHFSLDIIRLLDEYQLHSFASEINDALNADRNAARIEQMELRGGAERAAA